MLPTTVVSPVEWFYHAAMYDQLVTEHPRLSAMDLEELADAKAVRQQLREFRAQLMSSVRRFGRSWLRTNPARAHRFFRRGWSMRGGRNFRIAWRGGQGRAGDYTQEQLRAVERDMRISNSHLRAWLGLAFFDSIGRSEVLTDLMLGVVRLPDWRGDWGEIASVGAMVRTREDGLRPLGRRVRAERT